MIELWECEHGEFIEDYAVIPLYKISKVPMGGGCF